MTTTLKGTYVISATRRLNAPPRRVYDTIANITTEIDARGGLGGAIEKVITGRVLRPMYAEELRLLEAAAADPHGTAAAATARG